MTTPVAATNDVSPDDRAILAAILNERGSYEDAERIDSLIAPPPPPTAPTDRNLHDSQPTQQTLLLSAGAAPPSNDATTPPAPADEKPRSRPKASAKTSPSVQHRHDSQQPDPERIPWRYSVDLMSWSEGFPSEKAAILHAREAGHVSVWLGRAHAILHDARTVTIHTLEILGYRLGLTDTQLDALGEAIAATVARRFGPPLRIEPQRVVTLARERPATFDEVLATLDAGDYEGRPLLFARELAYVLECAHDRILPLIDRYTPAAILAVTRALVEHPNRSGA